MVQSLQRETIGQIFSTNSEKLEPIRALIYSGYRRTTIEEQSEPIFQYIFRRASPIREDRPIKINRLFDRSARKKRSLGYSIGLLNPYQGYGTGSAYGGYGGYGTPLGYGYNPPYGYGNSYGSGSGYGYGSGYGNYGYGYGSGYGSGYYDPNCNFY